MKSFAEIEQEYSGKTINDINIDKIERGAEFIINIQKHHKQKDEIEFLCAFSVYYGLASKLNINNRFGEQLFKIFFNTKAKNEYWFFNSMVKTLISFYGVNDKKTNKTVITFASKFTNIVFPDFPIFDSTIRSYLGLENSFEIVNCKVSNIKSTANKVEKIYSDCMQNILVFQQVKQHLSKKYGDTFSDNRIVDLIFWAK